MPSKKTKANLWWFSLTQMDIVAADSVYKKIPYSIVQRIFFGMAQKNYPKRPNKAKSKWMESVNLAGQTYQLCCSIDEDLKKVKVSKIIPPNKMTVGKKNRR